MTQPAPRLRVATVVTRLIAGAGGVALRGALELDPERYQVTILAADSDSALFDQAEHAGLQVVRLREMAPELDPRADRRAYRELVTHFSDGRYDVVHTHSAKAGALGRLAASRVDIPAIVHTLHGFPFHEFQSRPRRAAYIAIERRLGRRTDAVLAVGSAVAAQTVRLGLAAPERVRTIGAAIDTTAVVRATPAARAAARRALRIPPGMKVVGTVGRLDYQKAPEVLVEAIRQLDRSDVYTIWIGDGPLTERAHRHIKRAGLADRFVLLGHRADVGQLLAGFDVFALPSRYEGLPCAIVEAMAADIPVVATAVNAVPDVVVPGQTGLLVAPQQPDQLAAAIAYLLDSPAYAARMATAARVALGDRFTTETLGRVLDETYRHALGLRDPAIAAIPLARLGRSA